MRVINIYERFHDKDNQRITKLDARGGDVFWSSPDVATKHILYGFNPQICRFLLVREEYLSNGKIEIPKDERDLINFFTIFDLEQLAVGFKLGLEIKNLHNNLFNISINGDYFRSKWSRPDSQGIIDSEKLEKVLVQGGVKVNSRDYIGHGWVRTARGLIESVRDPIKFTLEEFKQFLPIPAEDVSEKALNATERLFNSYAKVLRLKYTKIRGIYCFDEQNIYLAPHYTGWFNIQKIPLDDIPQIERKCREVRELRDEREEVEKSIAKKDIFSFVPSD